MESRAGSRFWLCVALTVRSLTAPQVCPLQNEMTVAVLLTTGGHSSISFVTQSGCLHQNQLECLLVGKKNGQ